MTIRTLTFVVALHCGAAWLLPAADESPLKTLDDKFSYTLGVNLGKQLKQNDVQLNVDVYLKGLNDARAGKDLLLTEEEGNQVMREFQTALRTRQLEKGTKEGAAFLAENKKKEGVLTTASGLQYKIATKGTGKTPGSNDTVVTHYRGTLIDGSEFDNSYKRGEPTTFGVTGVIKGWTEALLMMPVGSKWQLFVPSELAYGERGRPGIPPNSTLLFDIELLEIKPPEAPAAAVPGAVLGAPKPGTPVITAPAARPLPATPANPATKPAPTPGAPPPKPAVPPAPK